MTSGYDYGAYVDPLDECTTDSQRPSDAQVVWDDVVLPVRVPLHDLIVDLANRHLVRAGAARRPWSIRRGPFVKMYHSGRPC